MVIFINNLSKYKSFYVSLFLLTLVGCATQQQEPPIVTAPVELKCPSVPAPLSPAVVVISEPKVCPKIKAPAKIKEVPAVVPVIVKQSDLLTVGRVENVGVEQLKLTLKAKIDSGALLTSMNAIDLKNFERDGKDWVRFSIINPTTNKKQMVELPLKRTKVIKQLDGKNQRRPVVSLTLKIGPITDQVDVTLSNRTGYNYQLLIGRNFMWDRILIDVGKSFIADSKK